MSSANVLQPYYCAFAHDAYTISHYLSSLEKRSFLLLSELCENVGSFKINRKKEIFVDEECRWAKILIFLLSSHV